MDSKTPDAYGQPYGGAEQQYHQPPPPYGQQPVVYPQQMSSMSSNVVVTNTAPQQPLIIRETRLTSPSALDIGAMVLAVWNTFCCFIPLGIAAMIVSGVAFCYRGDAKHEAADKLSKISLALSITGLILGVILIIVIVVVVATTADDYPDYK
ncbi:uncharacterized protein [Ptychodera flava]|uniref:uncharacterized protein n=1 Tax=Ptychodera flava TaxID=63121 RepID=UPI00396AACA2